MHALYHETTVSTFKNIIKNPDPTKRKLMTGEEQWDNKIFGEGGMGSGDGFPGLFFSLLFASLEPHLEDDANIILVFPIDLMKCQKNWHYNLIDRNGAITYDTYYSHNICNAPHPNKVKDFVESGKKKYPGNELIFHDGIDINLVSKILHSDNVNLAKDKGLGKYKLLLQPISDFKNDSPVLATDAQKKLLNPYLLPVILSWSDAGYTGIEYRYYNKPSRNRVSFPFFYKLISSALPKPILEELDNANVKNMKDLDKFLRKPVRELLRNNMCRSSQNFCSWLKNDPNPLCCPE